MNRLKALDRFCKFHGLPRPHGLAGGGIEDFEHPERVTVVPAKAPRLWAARHRFRIRSAEATLGRAAPPTSGDEPPAASACTKDA